jgi:NlpC/P60 family putative phage cell wall peptidase
MNRDLVVDAARAWLGTPYRHRAATLGAGCDCLGLLRGVWRDVIGDEPEALPNYARDWRRVDGDALEAAFARWLVRAESEAQAGQAVLFRIGRDGHARHCGIMVSATRFIHAQERLGVVEANMGEGWAKRIAGLYDFPGVHD